MDVSQGWEKFFWSSPIAIISAIRALARASAMAADWLVVRRETTERLSKPTAMTVSRANKLSVTTSVKPGGFRLRCGVLLEEEEEGFIYSFLFVTHLRRRFIVSITRPPSNAVTLGSGIAVMVT